MLLVYTSRLSGGWRGHPDALDITRAGARWGRSGVSVAPALAPSWALLKPALELRDLCWSAVSAPAASVERRAACADEAAAWAKYRADYVAEMRRSYRRNWTAWQALLMRPRVVLLCYCGASPLDGVLRCHRLIAAHLLERCGAKYQGEVSRPEVLLTGRG